MRASRTTGERLRQAGFDLTKYDWADKSYRVRCSQCEVLVINGVATHERDCPNQSKRKARRNGCQD